MAEVDAGALIPTVKAQTAAPENYLESDPKAAAGLQQVGQATSQVGKLFGQLQGTDVMNKADNQAQALMSHYATLQGEDALNAAPIVQQQINDIYSQARGSLGSLDQLNVFDQGMQENIRTYGRQISSQAHDGSIEYARATIQSSSNNADNNANQAGAIADNDTSLASFTTSLNQSVRAAVRGTQIEGNGGDASVVQDATNQARSRTASAYIISRANYNPQLGMDAYTKLKGLLNPEDQQKLLGYVHEKVMPQTAQTIAGQVMAGGGEPVQSVSDDQWNAQLQKESSGLQLTATGQPLTSSAGATGVAQVELATAEQVAAQNHIPWNLKQFQTDKAYNSQIGRLYMNSLLTQFNGNYQVALAAYNAGPNNKGVQHFAQTGDMSQMPQQTQDYVSGLAPASNDMEYQISQTTAKLQAEFPDDPEGAAQAAYSAVYRLSYQRDAVQRNQQKAQVQATNQFATAITTEIHQAQDSGKPLDPNLLTRIDSTPNIDWQTRDDLRKMAMDATGQTEISGFGTGYTSALQSIVAPFGTAGKIVNESQIVHLQAQGLISSTGARQLIETLGEMRTTQGAGAATYKSGMLDYLRNGLTYDGQDSDIPGMPALRDPAGVKLYETKAIPMFEASYNKWVGDGKDPLAYPSAQVDAIVKQIMPSGQLAQAKIAAESGMTPGAPAPAAGAPLPPPPAGIDAVGWHRYVTDVPKSSGTPFNPAQWYQALTYLSQHPDPKSIEQFNTNFGPYGYNAAEILSELRPAPAPADNGSGNPMTPAPVVPEAGMS